MAFIEENDALVPTPTSSRVPGWSATSPDRYVSPAVQAQRDADAGRLLVAEYPSVEAARASSAALRRELPKVKGDARGMLSGQLERLDRGLAGSPVTPIEAAPRTVKPAEQASQSGFITEGEALGSFISEEEATGIRPKTSPWERVKEDVGAMLGIKGPVTAGSIAQRGYDWLTKPTLDESNSSVFERGQKMDAPTKAEYAAAAPIRERIGALPKPTLQSERPTGAQVIARGAAGVVPQLSDMLTSTGKQVLTLPIYAAGYAYQRSQGVDSPTAAKLAMQNKDKLLPDTIFAPWRTIAENLGGEAKAAYEKNPVAWVMGQIGEVVTSGGEAAASKLNVPPEHFAAITDEVMGLMGVHAFKPAVAKAIAARLEQMTGVSGRPGMGGFGGFAEAPRERVTPDMSAPQVKAIVDSALAGRGPLETIWPPEPPKVKTKAAKVTPMTEMARTLTEESPYVEPPKASRVPGEAGPEPVQGPPAPERPAIPPRERPILLAALEKQQEGLLIDAQEARVLRQSGLDAKTTAPLVTQALDQLREGKLISQEQAKALRTLKVDVERGVVKGPSGQTLFERGKADPALLGVLSVLGLGAAMAPQLVDWWNNSGGLSGDNSMGLALAGAGAAGAMKGKVFLEKNPGFADTVLKTPQGELAALYHGGKALESGMPSQGSGRFGEGTYFTDSAKRASGFGKDGAVYPAHANLKNPISADAFAERYGMGIKTPTEARRITKELQAEGYDGVVDKLGDRYTEVVAFEPEAQVRSAISGEAEPKLLAGIAAGTAAALYLANNPIDDFTKAALALVGTVGVTKGRFADMPLPEVIKAYRESTGRSKELAAAKIYEDTNRQLTRSVQQMVKDQNLPVEDIVQETYMSAFKALDAGAYDGTRAALPTFLHAIAKNELRQMYRRPVEQTARRTGSLEVDPETQAAVVPEKYLMEQNPERYKSAYDEAAQTDLGSELERAFQKLPEDQQAAFKAIEMDEMSYAEAAEMLGIPEGTVKSQVNRAKAGMQRFLTLYSDRQAGKASIKDMMRVAAVAGGAAIGAVYADDPQKGAIVGGLVGLGGALLGTGPAGMALKRSTTKLAEIYPPLRRAARDLEHSAAVEISAASNTISDFIKPASKLSKAQYAALDKAYSEADPQALAEVIKGHPELVAGYGNLRKMLDAAGERLVAEGRFKEGIPDYLPLMVKDYKGLMESLGRPVQEGLKDVLHKAELKSQKKYGRPLTEVERSAVTSRYLLQEPSTSYLPAFAKARRLRMTEETRPFYHTMEHALIHYAHGMVSDLATTKFFDRDLVTSKVKGQKFTNVEGSISQLTNRALDEGKITPEQAVELQQVLRARFIGGEKSPSPWLQDVRNISGIGLLGQIGSGVVQTSEALLSAYHHSLFPALKAAGTLLTGKGIKPAEFGLANHVIEEVVGQRRSGKALSLVLKANLLAAFDQLGMKQNLTASFYKNKRLAETPGGRAKLAEKWGDDYGPDLPQVIQELQQSTVGNRTPLVESLLYQELSDIRPTSRMEAPVQFNAHPNARIFYHLQQFMLTQADILYRDAYKKIVSGNPRQMAVGFKNLALYASALALVSVPADAIKDWMMGRELKLDKIDYVDNFVRNFGLSRYSLDTVEDSKVPGKTALGEVKKKLVPPAFSVAERLVEGLSDPRKLVPLVPLGGRIAYNRAFGGNEEAEISQIRRENRKLLEERKKLNPSAKLAPGEKKPLSPAAQQYLREKKLKEKQKQLERNAP